MRFDVLTLFPDMFRAVLGDSIINRAVQNGLIEFHFIDIRDFTKNKHRKVDDYPYSGGGGMLMSAQPVYDAYQSIAQDLDYKPLTIYMSPQGKVFNQQLALDLSKEKHIVILCGHYEGIDQRVLDMIVDMEISIGDFVLTGGEIPAMAVIDSVSRMIPGVLASENSYTNESHFNGLLEYPQYTRPEEFMGVKIPDVLISGHHAKINEWKHEQALKNTYLKRPDMLEKLTLSEKDAEFIKRLKNDC
ncbi:MAG: tRNA (guanosine(37)-N1)-methyltransferase TrmD [Clostridia bacterium]|nr:tRNA (guanosine(37)-N1)-methyltransferase TrmD [Clostridia bacterium]